MKQKLANYTVIIEKEKRTGTNELCFTASVPFLGLATEADSIEEAEKEINALIQFHLESLTQEGEEIPIETSNSFVTKTEVRIPENAVIAL